MREDNIALLKRGYEAFARGDLATVRAMSAEDEVWYTTGVSFESEHKGADSVIAYLAKLGELTNGTFRAEPEKFLADGDSVAVVEHLTGSRLGRVLDTHFIHVYDIDDGKIVRVTEYEAEPRKLEEFWS